jgi:questin oxidase-like protein
MSKPTLERLLDDSARFDLSSRGTADHLPMALVALSRMGAAEERLVEYFRWWEENRALPRRDSGRQIDRRDWKQYTGDPRMFDALWDTFRRWSTDRGSAEVISAVFPELSGGVAAVAFHGLIRLAYGIESDHAGEIAAGLAAICSRYVDLGLQVGEALPTASVESAFARIADALCGAVFPGDSIIGWMRAAAADPRLTAALSCPTITPTLLEDLAQVSIALYWQTSDFTVLHMVTTVHAARVLFGRFPQLASDDAIRALWASSCAAYAAAGAPLLARVALPSEVPPWHKIFADAVISNDAHVIKMAYTCHCESAQYGNPLYQAAAARLVAIGRA